MDDDFLAILDCIDTPMFILEQNSDGEPVYVALNKRIRNNAKLTYPEAIGKTAAELYKGRFGVLAYNNHRECFRTGKKMQYELTVQLEDYNNHVQTTLEPMLDDQGRTYRVVGTSNPIAAEYLIREAQANTLTVNAEIEQLINLSAHDLRSPMQNIKKLTELLLEDFQDLGDGKLELIKLLEKVSDSTFALIANIINFAQASGAAESVEDFELPILCREIISMLDPNDIHTLEVCDARLSGDKIATQIVIRNLIDNAIKHNQGAAITIQIDAQQVDKHNFTILVQDNGKGMENPAALFKGETPTKIDSGYGLHGVMRLLRARGGKISATPAEKGTGVTVAFSLPGKAALPNL